MNIMTAKLFPVASTCSTPSLADVLWLTNTDNMDRAFLQSWRSSWRLSLSEVMIKVVFVQIQVYVR